MSRWDETYRALAGCYDEMTQDVRYPAWADFLEKLFSREKRPVKTVLDLACGTGTMSFLLAQRGYEMIGVDFSPEMLAIAAGKELEGEGEPPIFLCQTMEELDLYGTVDACVCLLDSVNHVTRPDKLYRAFQRVHLFLEPGGLFVFDVHTPRHLEGLDGGVFLDETEDAYCVWRTDYHPKRQICTYVMDVFSREAGSGGGRRKYTRSGPIPRKSSLPPSRRRGFQRIRLYGDRKLRPPQAGEERIFFTAHKPKETAKK